ncbi:MAG TPA: MMPL family transporter [Acidimicrobiales bacterium]
MQHNQQQTAVRAGRDSALRRLGRLSYRRRRRVLAAWILLAIGLLALSGAAAGTFEDEFELPGSESQDAVELLEAGGFPTRAGFQGQLVVASDRGVEDPAVAGPVTDLLGDIAATVPDATVSSPYEPSAGSQISDDGTVAFAEISLADRDDASYEDAVAEIRDLVEGAQVPGAQLELGGDRFAEEAEGGSEAVGVLAAVVILLIAFGSLLAMGLPLLTAAFGIGTGAALVTLLANVVTMPSFTLQLVLMLGIGVGIDYALFIVTRYREGLAEGRDPAGSVELAIDTAGRAVLFAGTTVVVSVLGLLVVGLDVNRALGIAAASGVAMTMLAAVTLLPAVLGFVGHNIDRLGLPHRHRAGPGGGTMWRRWSQVIQRRPAVPATLALVVLVVLAVPTFGMRLGFGDAGNRPETDTTRRAYDLLAEGFGPGVNGPLFLAASVPDTEAADAFERLATELQGVEGVAGATPAIPNEAGDVALVTVYPASAPQDEETTELVNRLRDDVLPAASEGNDLEVLVGGAQASVVDFADFNADRLPVFIAVVLAVSFVVLMAVFRSLLVPLKAVVMNLLSIGAAYGVIVAVFQLGWGAGLIGAGEPGPVEAWAPMMLFAIVFGLSMDYEVFLLSRIREHYDTSGDNATAVANGLASTARVITAAAAIMIVVFAGFVLSPDRSLQLFGLGLATAVLVDATIVRLVVVPATMELLGDRNWWLPRWLDRVLPAIHIEGTAPQAPSPETPHERERTAVGATSGGDG